MMSSFRIADLPSYVTDRIFRDVEQYCVTLVVAGKDQSAATCSGVLVVASNRYAILTAKHVWQSIERARRQTATADLQIMLGGNSFLSLEMNLLYDAMSITTDIAGPHRLRIPDLALIGLSTEVATALSARSKTFYSLDKRRGVVDFTGFQPDGVFVAVGAPLKLARIEKKQATLLAFFTDVDEPLMIEDWDVIRINLNLEDNPALPHTFGGMSGGGLWRVPIAQRLADGEYLTSPSILSGIIYGETESNKRTLLASGQKSIFRAVYA